MLGGQELLWVFGLSEAIRPESTRNAGFLSLNSRIICSSCAGADVLNA